MNTVAVYTSQAKLLIAFPISATALRLVFSEPVDPETATRAECYRSLSGLKIHEVSLDSHDPTRVTLRTDPMPTWMDQYQEGEQEDTADDSAYERASDEVIRIDAIHAAGVRSARGTFFARTESPLFLQGIPSVAAIQLPRENNFPFISRFVGLVAAHEYNPDGGVPHTMIDSLGFMFLHRQTGGAFDSIKIVTNKQVPGLAEAVAERRAGKRSGLHVRWAGGEIRTVDGETQLVDTGFMEGSLVDPPLNSPPPVPIKAAEIGEAAGWTMRAKSLQGVIVQFDHAHIDYVADPDVRGLRSFVFHDGSGVRVAGLLLPTVTRPPTSGEACDSLRGVVHQPCAGHYEVIVELDEDLRPASK
jgi:hypothetical protein